jgi:hypothetical protein
MRSLSLKALSLTSTLIPTLYDVVFSDDKEKVNTALATLLPTVVNSFLRPNKYAAHLKHMIDDVYGWVGLGWRMSTINNLFAFGGTGFVCWLNRQAGPAQLAFAYPALRLFSGLLKYHNTFKVWRKEMTDLFYGSEFFQMDFNAISEWTSIINYIMKVDKAAFPDLQRMDWESVVAFTCCRRAIVADSREPLGILSKSLQTHQASMMFVSKEQENLMRARNIKRLSFVLYSGEIDLYQSHLSWIQEKLVEALKLPDAYPVYVEVFHCLRILLLRVSSKRLMSFWPVIFAELVCAYRARAFASIDRRRVYALTFRACVCVCACATKSRCASLAIRTRHPRMHRCCWLRASSSMLRCWHRPKSSSSVSGCG